MAYEEIIQSITLEADADLSASQYRFVDITGVHNCGAVAASGQRSIGVLQNKPDAANKAATVAVHGVSKVECGGSVTAGDEVTTDASGKAVTAAGGNHVLGVALDTGADTELIPVLLQYRGTA